jgi:hypothetical protein
MKSMCRWHSEPVEVVEPQGEIDENSRRVGSVVPDARGLIEVFIFTFHSFKYNK